MVPLVVTVLIGASLVFGWRVYERVRIKHNKLPKSPKIIMDPDEEERLWRDIVDRLRRSG